MSLTKLLRQVAAVLSAEIARDGDRVLHEQPGRVFFPKQVHELRPTDGEAPDSLSADYIMLALNRNAAAADSRTVQSATAVLAAHILDTISQAALIERQLLTKLE